jgi:hypothetical protein
MAKFRLSQHFFPAVEIISAQTSLDKYRDFSPQVMFGHGFEDSEGNGSASLRLARA